MQYLGLRDPRVPYDESSKRPAESDEALKRDDFPSVEPVPVLLELKDLSGANLPVQLETKDPLFMEASGKLDFSLRIHLRGLEVSGPVMLHVAAGVLERPLLPVLSPPFFLRPTTTGRGDVGGATLPDPARLSLEQCRLVDVPGCGSLLLAECRGDLGIGGGVWDGGLVLLEYLAHPAQRTRLEGRRVLELGRGLVGLGCALLGAQDSVGPVGLEEV
eukprot:s780_g9.t1